MMKLSKVTWIFLIIGVMLIAGASLGMTHSRQVEQQRELEQQIRNAKQKLALINNSEIQARQEQLIAEMSTFDSQFESNRVKLESGEDSISATEELLSAAPSFGVRVKTLTSSGFSTADLAGIECDILSLDIQVDGNLYNVRDYITDLSSRFPTCIVKSVQLSSQPGEEEVPGLPSEMVASAKVSLVIYEYKGE